MMGWKDRFGAVAVVVLVLASESVLFAQDTHDGQSSGVEIVVPSVLREGAPPFVSLDWKARLIPQDLIPEEPSQHPGYQLCATHCVACHLSPEPQQLSRQSWPFAITWMSNYLGYTNHYGPFQGLVVRERVPARPVVTEAELVTISSYLQVYAPTEAEVREGRDQAKPKQRLFRSKNLPNLVPPASVITLLDYDDRTDRYTLGWANEKRLLAFSQSFRPLFQTTLSSEPIGWEPEGKGGRVAAMGHFLRDRSLGGIYDLEVQGDGVVLLTPVVKDFPRIADYQTVDMDADGRSDCVVVGFGSFGSGRVSVFWGGAGDDEAVETVVYPLDGAVKLATNDFNRDGRLDLMVLTAQQTQELLVFYQGEGRTFESHTVQKQFAGFGNNHFTLSDMNRDHRQDVVLSSGNNLEMFEVPPKSHHGIRILENIDGRRFEEKYFYPMFGTLLSVVEDFDGDGDPDIAAVAFYPDWHASVPETFVYLENRGNYNFVPQVLSESDWGRWISMTTGDIDDDGDRDLILGGGYLPVGVPPQRRQIYLDRVRNKPSVVILENLTRP